MKKELMKMAARRHWSIAANAARNIGFKSSSTVNIPLLKATTASFISNQQLRTFPSAISTREYGTSRIVGRSKPTLMDPSPPKKEDEEKESPDFEDVHDKEPIVDIGPGTKFLAIGFMAVGFLSAIYEYSQDHKDGSHLKVPETLAEVQAPITDRVYFDIQIDEEPPERLIIGVYGTVYPQTARNFVQICDTGVSTGDSVISYVNNKIQNILNDFMIIGPSKFVPDLDAAVFNNYLTKNEDLTIKHSGLGVVTNTMNRGDSHFMITFRPVKNLDHRNVAFGQVLEGAPLLQQLWKMRTIGNAGVPPQNIRVVATGVLPRRADGVELPPTSEKKN